MTNYPTSLPSATPADHGEVVGEIRAIATELGLPAAGGVGHQRPYWAVGQYVYIGGQTTEMVPIEGTLYATPFPLMRACTLDRIGLYIGTQGGAGEVVRMGIYEDSQGVPGALVLDAGTVAAATTGLKEVTISQALDITKRYWLAFATQGASGTVARPRSILGTPYPVGLTVNGFTGTSYGAVRLSGGGTTGAFPDPFGAVGTEVVDCPWFGVRTSA